MKERYRKLCQIELGMPLFMNDWWLDTVCGCDGWGVTLAEKNNIVVAVMPYAIRSKFGFKVVEQPKLTPFLGVWFIDRPATVAGFREVISELISSLPKFSDLSLNFHSSFVDWLPFYWGGYNQTIRYTYRLSLQKSHLDLWAGLRANIRREIKKAKGRYSLKVVEGDIQSFIRLNRLVYERQGRLPPYSDDFLRSIDRVLGEKNCRKILMAVDSEGNQHAAAYIVWDDNVSYYLMGGSDPNLRTSGAMSLCLWESIKFSSGKVETFDFEGSMIQSVERYFRAFGGVQDQYFNLYKTPSFGLRLYRLLTSFK